MRRTSLIFVLGVTAAVLLPDPSGPFAPPESPLLLGESAWAQTRAERLQRRMMRREQTLERLQRMRRMEAIRRAERTQLRRWTELRRARMRLESRRSAARLLMRGANGGWQLRAEILAVGVDTGVLDRVRAEGFAVARQRNLPGLGLELVVLRIPPGLTPEAALDLAQTAAPEGRFALHHLFDPSAAAGDDAGRAVLDPAADRLPWDGLPSAAGARIGLLDTAIDAEHPALADAAIRARSFADAAPSETAPAAHGTAVASLLVGRLGSFVGAAAEAELVAADVFGDAETGGSLEAILAALDWLSREELPVIAMPLAGPANPLLELALDRLARSGILIVAPVGNDGPTEPVAYPAAYQSVVAVTATDLAGQVFLTAHRGPEVLLAAVGVAIPAAAEPNGLIAVEGTSFAVPEVAGRLLRRHVSAGNRLSADTALRALRRSAVDLGAPGRDPVYGEGWVSYVRRAQ